MQRIVPVLLAIALVPGAVLATWFGLFLIGYGGDFPGANVSLHIGSVSVDTDIVGAVVLLAASGMLVAAVLLVRRAHRT